MLTSRSILNEARLRKGWSIAVLHRKSGVATHASNLRRKLEPTDSKARGKKWLVALDPSEVTQLASALGVEVPDSVIMDDVLAGRVARGWAGRSRSRRSKRKRAA